MFGAYIFTIVVSLLGLIPWSLCGVLLSCNGLYFKVYFVWYDYSYSSFLLICICMEYLFPSPYFVCMSLDLKWVSCRQHVYRSSFCIHLASLCLQIGAFNPFTFKVIINIYVLIAILLLDFCRSFVPFFLVLCSCDLMTIFVLCLDSFFFIVCICIIDFWFVVTMRF